MFTYVDSIFQNICYHLIYTCINLSTYVLAYVNIFFTYVFAYVHIIYIFH